MQITIPHRFWRMAGWGACLAGILLGSIFTVGVFSTGGQWWTAPIAFSCCVFAGGALGITWLNHAPKLEISQKGILAKRFLRTHFYHWNEFIQAGVTWTQNRGIYYHEIVMLLPGGSLREKYDTLFFLRNIRNIIYLPYRDDILIYVLQGYGKLDFCFQNGSQEEAYYTIEEKRE